jgi:hypothetical protein
MGTVMNILNKTYCIFGVATLLSFFIHPDYFLTLLILFLLSFFAYFCGIIIVIWNGNFDILGKDGKS